MPFLLGLDTGGTYTDAALLYTKSANAKPTLVAKAKSLTTKHDLNIGLDKAIKNALKSAKLQSTEFRQEKISCCCLSTTLATNALVEGQGSRVALIAIGFSPQDMQRAGLEQVLDNDILIHLQGGHTSNGIEAKPLDISPLQQQIKTLKNQVSGFAIVGYFAVRNQAHENKVRQFIEENVKNCPITCSHELSQNLNGPKRAITTLLNSKLVPLITRLIDSAKIILQKHDIACPLMIVRGDGSLVKAEFARGRPIETILSGPAASVIGARFLTNKSDAVVCDIGGTTSDIAILQNGMPRLEQQGAKVGNHRTMVEAIAINSFALGGDSEIHLNKSSEIHLNKNSQNQIVQFGPRRVIPLCLLGTQYKEIIQKQLQQQLQSPISSRYDGKFVLRIGNNSLPPDLPDAQKNLYEKISQQPQLVANIIENATQAAALTKLLQQALIVISSLTPSDILHFLKLYNEWDSAVAELGLKLLARRYDRQKNTNNEITNLAKNILAQMQRRSAEIILQTIWQEENIKENYINHNLIQNTLDIQANSTQNKSLVDIALTLEKPLIGLGASSHQYHKACEKLLNCKVIIPEHADVANAIGAGIGQIILRFSLLVAEQNNGGFVIIGEEKIYKTKQQAFQQAEKKVCDKIKHLSQQAGAIDTEIKIDITEKNATIENRKMLIEANIQATAYGRPSY